MEPFRRARWPLTLALATGLLVFALAQRTIDPIVGEALAARATGALGLFALARERGLGRPGAALAALALAFSAPLGPAFSAPLGEAAATSVVALPSTAWLPWVLFGLERARRSPRPVGLALAALAQLALCSEGQAAEVVAASLGALVWCLMDPGRAPRDSRWGLAALAAGSSIAWLAGSLPNWPEPSGVSSIASVDLLSLGLVLLAAGAVTLWRPRSTGAPAVAIALGLLMIATWLQRRGLAAGLSELATPSLFPPRPGGQSPAIPLPALGLALCTLLGAGGPWPRWRSLTWIALLLALDAPGIGQLWRVIPILGELTPTAFAGLASLSLALGAGAAFERAQPAARLAAGVLLSGLVILGCLSGLAAIERPSGISLDVPNDVISYAMSSAPEFGARGGPLLLGGVDAGLPAERVGLRLTALDRRLPERRVEARFAPGQVGPGRPFVLELPEQAAPLEAGRWWVVLEVLGAEAGGARPVLGRRSVGVWRVLPSIGDLARVAIALLLALSLLVGGRNPGALWVVLASGLART